MAITRGYGTAGNINMGKCAHITPEWRKQYIQYEEMKAMLCNAIHEAPSSEVVEPEVLDRYYAKFDETFFTFCEKELTKINTFYSEKLAEATRKIAALKSELARQHELSVGRRRGKGDTGFFTSLQGNKREENPIRKLQDVKLAFSEYYLSLVLLQNYQSLNYTGFRKILKKHDKNLSTDAGARWRSEHVDSAHFYINKDIDKLIQDTENTFISELEDGNRQKAMKRLRVPPLGDKQSPWTTFKVGLFCGAFVVLLISVVLSWIFYDFSVVGGLNSSQPKVGIGADYGKDQELKNDWRIVVRLYRGPLLFVIFMFLMGINVYGWRSSGVNHVLIFELDPRNHLSEQHIMELAAVFGVIWTLSVLSFLYSDHLSIPAFVNPLALVIIMFLFMLNPTKTFRHEARFWMVRVLCRVVTAPLCYVGFADFWVADQLNSLAPALDDLYYLICFYSNHTKSTVDGEWQIAVETDSICPDWVRPLVISLPAWFRFAQCLRRYKDTREAFPHLVNAGKYSTTFFVVLFHTLYKTSSDGGGDRGPFFYLWIVSMVASSCYTYTWDIKMDWGLMDGNEDNRFLREEVVYSSKAYYYFAILEDFVLRLGWAVKLTFVEFLVNSEGSPVIEPTIVTSILAFLEIFRRFVWNFFRLENEHLNNCGKFRAVRDISVAPIDASDQAQIIKMMDEEDGYLLVRKRRKTHGAAGTLAVASAAAGANAAGALKTKELAESSGSRTKKVTQAELLKPLLDTAEVSFISGR